MEGPMVHDFEKLGTISTGLNVRDQTCNLGKR